MNSRIPIDDMIKALKGVNSGANPVSALPLNTGRKVMLISVVGEVSSSTYGLPYYVNLQERRLVVKSLLEVGDAVSDRYTTWTVIWKSESTDGLGNIRQEIMIVH